MIQRAGMENPGRQTGRIVGGALVLALATAAVIAHLRASDRQDAVHVAHLAATVDYLPGVAADVFLPSRRSGTVPVVVLVPGGAWRSADRTGLRPLADALADAGFLAVTASYRVGGDDARYPVPVQDIECAVSFAVHRAAVNGITPDPVVLAGHSSGAHLAALAALGTTGPAGSCPYPPAIPDGFVGLSGPYDQMLLADLAVPLFGVPPGVNPELWKSADPVDRARLRPELAVLLLHGAADRDVSPTFSTMFADALRKGGHAVRVTVVDGADHASIYTPQVSADDIVQWVRHLSRFRG